MSWLAISIEVDADAAERVGDALLDAGALSIDVADAAAGTPQEQPQFGEPRGVPVSGWQRSRVRALFAPETEPAAPVSVALSAARLPASTPYCTERVEDQDWVRLTQSQFGPMQISERMWIVPSWHALPCPGAVNILLDPGLAFGTGTHPTTRLALRWLEAQVRGGEAVIDYGCGSGILAIAAMKLGAARACGVDIDDQALLAARRNAMQNRIEARFMSAAQDVREPAGLVVANILANPLILLAPLLAGLTAQGGRLALSGILTWQAEEVRDAYSPWFDMEGGDQEDGWILLSGTKR